MKNRAVVTLTGSVLLLALNTPLSFAGTIDYEKFFFLENPGGKVTKTTKVLVGAEVDTWANKDSKKFDLKTITILDLPGTKDDVTKDIRHCKEPTHTASDAINIGFPLVPGAAVSEEELGNLASSLMVAIADTHDAPNKADAKINGDGGAEFNFEAWIEAAKSVQTVNKKDIGFVKLEGSATAGEINDDDKCHSASSVAAVHIGALEAFTFDGSAKKPKINSFGKNTLIGSGLSLPGTKSAKNAIDPFWVTLTDLDTGEAITEIVMSQILESVNGIFSIDDAGILLSISALDSESFVSLSFSSNSDWVENPYSYSYTLDGSGLSVSGDKFPLSDWTVMTTASTVSAFFPFGAGGQPFDVAEISPPDGLLVQDHTYRFAAGASEGVWVAETVPEPGSLCLIGLGALALLGYRRRLRRALGDSP
ncbi:MAG: PEP-CTERM sorting domain-containing protein [Pseudomonadota bacterium]